MRIISGLLKGKSINFLKNSKTRPLKDSVKEKFELNDKDGFVETKPVKTPKIFNEEDFYGGEIDYDEE